MTVLIAAGVIGILFTAVYAVSSWHEKRQNARTLRDAIHRAGQIRALQHPHFRQWEDELANMPGIDMEDGQRWDG